MQSIYVSTRRLVASLLIGAHLLHATMILIGGIDPRASVGVAAAALSIVLLLTVLSSAKARLGIDLGAFLTSMIGTAICWGATPPSSGFIAYVLPVAVALGYSTAAVVLKVERDAPTLRERR